MRFFANYVDRVEDPMQVSLRPRARLLLLSAAVVCGSLAIACDDPPTLNALVESSGSEHSLVMVQGTDLFGSSVVWDAGLSSETVVPGGFLGGYLFTVPPGAALGFAFGTIVPGPPGTTDFATLKAANFDNANRDRIYHYAIWANMIPGGFSGVSDVDFIDGGDDFVVSFDDFQASFQTLRSQVETFVHEFGHDLNQRHGGDTHSQFKPNYWSAMSYAWQLRSGQTNATRRTRTTCSPIYWGDAAATEPNGAPPASPNAFTDYSHGMGPTLVEDNGTLDENIGVCGVPVHWNSDGDTVDSGLSLDADLNGAADETLRDFGNWRALSFVGPRTNGVLTP